MWQSYVKSSEEQNKFICFFFRDGVTSRFNVKLRKVERRTKQIHLFFLSE